MTSHKSQNRAITGALLGTPLVAALAGIAYSKLAVDHTMMPAALGERRDRHAGRAHATRRARQPLLPIHSINAAASAYEVRPLYEHSGACATSTLDLFGWLCRALGAQLHVAPVRRQSWRCSTRSAATLAPMSTLAPAGSEFRRAASEHPTRFDTVALVAPPAWQERQGMAPGARGNQAAKRCSARLAGPSRRADQPRQHALFPGENLARIVADEGWKATRARTSPRSAPRLRSFRACCSAPTSAA